MPAKEKASKGFWAAIDAEAELFRKNGGWGGGNQRKPSSQTSQHQGTPPGCYTKEQELPFKRAAVEDLGKCQQAVRQCSAAGRHSRDVPDTGRLPRVAPEQDAPPGYVEMASDIYAVKKSMVNGILMRL